MKEIFRLILGRTAKNSAITVGSNIIYGLFITLFIVIASRSLGPEKFGLVSIALAIFTITFDITSLGTSQTLIRFVSRFLGKRQPRKAREVASSIFKLRLIEAIFLAMTAIFIGRFLSLNLYHNPELTLPLTITLAASGGILLIDFFISLTQAYEQFVKSALLSFITAALKIVFIFALVLSRKLSVFSTTLSFVVTPFLATLVGLSFISTDFINAKAAKALLQKLFHFAKWMALWGITASLAGRIDILLMGKFATAYETGIYSVASRLATGYIVIGGSFASVLTPKMSRIADDSQKLRHNFVLIAKIVTVIGFGMLAIAVLAGLFIPFIFGSDYLPSIPIFQSLTLALVFFMASIPSNVSLLSLGYSKWIGFLSLIQLVVVVSLSIFLIPNLGAQGAAISLIISYAVSFALSTTYAVKKIF